MSKTTFKGYVPSLKLKGAEATIVEGKAIESKGGSIRYTLRGEYEGRPTLPKTVSKHDFENVYGFDAKEAEAVIITGKEAIGMGKKDVVQLHIVGEEDTMDFTPEKIVPITKYYKSETVVGSPSPADVEPPAPSEKPFPQEPTNENFSAETNFDCIVCDSDLEDIVKGHEEGSWITCQGDYAGDENACGRFFCSNHSNREDFKCPKCGGYEDRLTGTYRDFEAFGLFGGKDEEEEEEKPKQQEFTVIMQEGDKLELTDIEEKEESGDDTKDGNSDEDSENDEKEAESNCDCGCSIGECKCPEGCKCGCGDHDAEYEAVQAKVTRPVKEEKEEVKDDEEGGVDLGTIATVGAVGLGALAVGALLTAEDESDYWAGEDAYWRAEGGDADSTVVWELIQQNLNNPDTVRLYYSVIVGDPDEYEGDDMATTVAEAFQQNWRNEDFVNHISKELGFEIQEAEDFQKMTPSEYVPFDQMQEELGQMWDETTAPLADAHNYDYEPSNEPSNANFSAEMSYEVWERSDSSDNLLLDKEYDDLDDAMDGYNGFKGSSHEVVIYEITYDKDWNRIGKKDITPNDGRYTRQELENYANSKGEYGLEALQDIVHILGESAEGWDDEDCIDYILENQPANMRQLIGSPPFMEAETFEARTTRKHHKKMGDKWEGKGKAPDGQHIRPDYRFDRSMDEDDYDSADLTNQKVRAKIAAKEDLRDFKRHGQAETVGTPSPSGPSSVPEPAEATGSEPSNEHMEAEGSTMKWALGLTAIGVGISYLGYSDKILAFFDRLKK